MPQDLPQKPGDQDEDGMDLERTQPLAAGRLVPAAGYAFGHGLEKRPAEGERSGSADASGVEARIANLTSRASAAWS